MGDRGKPRVVVSACLLGEPVRYDGNARRCDTAIAILGPEVEWVPVCPEVGLGLGVPRETMQLEDDPDSPRMRTIGTRVDHTDGMLMWVGEALDRMAGEVHGFLLKSRSPSCGPAGVPVFAMGPDGVTRAADGPEQHGSGLFAQEARLRFPDAPMADEAAVDDPDQARLFLDLVCACRDQDL